MLVFFQMIRSIAKPAVGFITLLVCFWFIAIRFGKGCDDRLDGCRYPRWCRALDGCDDLPEAHRHLIYRLGLAITYDLAKQAT